MMAFSGARGNISQVRQLVGMRGLMADPQGQILDFPIRSNFREGLTLTEYVISCYGARKGLVDTALRTANSGYLTRRLVDVAQHVVVTTEDCETKSGIYINDMQDGRKVILSLQKRLIGRVLAEDIQSGTLFIRKNQDISPTHAAIISKVRKQVLVRSPLTCKETRTVCQLCYGWSLAHGAVVSLGEAVGILAAQSIGEPGTQLTMRTFHTGGVFSGDVMQEIRSPSTGTINFSSPLQGKLIRTLHGKIAFLTKVEGDFSISASPNKIDSKILYKIPASSVLFVRHKQEIKKGELVAEFSSFVSKTNRGIQAKFNLNAEKEGEIFFENVVLAYKETEEEDLIPISVQVGSMCILEGKVYESPLRSPFFPEIGDIIDTKTILNQSLLTTPHTGFLETVGQIEKKKDILTSSFQKGPNTEKSIHAIFQNKSKIQPFLNCCTPLPMSFASGAQQKHNKITKSTKKIEIKNPFAAFSFQKMQFNTFGYFFSVHKLKGILFFFPNALTNTVPKGTNSQRILSFQIIDTVFESRNLIKTSSNLKEYQGRSFFMTHRLYKLQQQLHWSEQKTNGKSQRNFILKKNTHIFSIRNTQGCEKTLQTRKKHLVFIEATTNKQIGSSIQKEKKIKFLYKENPQQVFKEDSFYKKGNTKVCSLPGFLHKEATSKKNSILLEKRKFFQNKEKSSLFFPSKIQLHSGWLMFLLAPPKSIFIHTRINRPEVMPLSSGHGQSNSFNFDQNFIFQKPIQIHEIFSFFQKPVGLKTLRYVNNKYCRIHKINRKKHPSYEKKQKISRYPLYKKHLYAKFPYLLITKKLNETTFTNRITKQTLLTNASSQLSNLKRFKVSSFINNKQQRTILAPLSINTNIEIKLLENKTRSLSLVTVPILCINYHLPKKESTTGTGHKIELSLPGQLILSTLRNLSTLNYLTLTQENSEKLVVTKENNIFEQQNFSLSSFCSPYGGEITSKTLDAGGKEKSLLVTVKEKQSFRKENEKTDVKLGQLVRYGDKVSVGTGIQEAGQIIELSKDTLTVRKAQPILFSSKGIFHIDQGDLIKKNTPLMTLFYQKLKTEDIVQGIPKIEELFEARQTKEGEALQRTLHTKLDFFFKFYRRKYNFEEATRKSFKQLQQILVQEVQKVYQSQGVTIADKHIEIIVREMTSKVKITESGQTGFFRGELTALRWVELVNLGMSAIAYSGIEAGITLDDEIIGKAEYEPIVLGITKAALETESFISAASFQETTRILSRAAIERKTDFLRGLKENVILGHIIPAGTGYKRLRDPDFVGIIGKKLSLLNYCEIVKTTTKIRTMKVKEILNTENEFPQENKLPESGRNLYNDQRDYLLKQELREKLWLTQNQRKSLWKVRETKRKMTEFQKNRLGF